MKTQPRWIICFILILPFFSTDCYILKQGTTLLGYQSQAEPIEQLLKEEALDPETRKFLKQVLDIKEFALRDLGLKEDSNYSRYVNIDRNLLAYVVSASDPVSFTPYEWSFPIVGKVPYKGFFNKEDARKEAEKLKARDLDVWIRGVDAFSTLGYFSDPLYSFMRSYSIHRLAELIVHEQTHATIFLKGESQFNEEFASFVGNEGSRLYILSRYGADSEEYANLKIFEEDQAAFLKEIRRLINTLENLYSSPLTREEKLIQKKETIQRFQQEFEESYEKQFRSDAYRSFTKAPINNAYLYLYRLYYPEDNFFQELYQKADNNLPLLIQAAKKIEGKKGEPRRLIENTLKKIVEPAILEGPAKDFSLTDPFAGGEK
jgi:predicted aminopeptidase